MKTKITVASLLLIGTIAFTSCMKKPMACFDTSKTTAAVNESISFTSTCSMDAHHYEWNFGDGSMSTDANPSHAYTNAGTYTVKLMTMSKNSKKDDETSKTITVQ